MRSALDTAPGIFASTEVGRAALEEGLVLVARGKRDWKSSAKLYVSSDVCTLDDEQL